MRGTYMSQDNIIDFKKHLEAKSSKSTKTVKRPRAQAPDPALVLDMTARRSEMLLSERREVRRTILTEFVGAFVILPNLGLKKVALYDISENGVAFDLNENEGRFKKGEEVAMRVYLNHKTYFSFLVTMKNAQYIEDECISRHGGEFVKGSVNDEALYHFIKFIETVSASLETDTGDVMVSNLND